MRIISFGPGLLNLVMSQEIAVVAVFGDLGRSPRMINHARELLKMKYEVNILGYPGGKLNSLSEVNHCFRCRSRYLIFEKRQIAFRPPFHFRQCEKILSID